MFRQGVPEQERTGHHSIEALCTYKRMDDPHHWAVSSMLSNNPIKTSYTQHFLSTKTKTRSLNMPTSQAQQSGIPAKTFNNLHGCTINFNCMPPPTTAPQPALQNREQDNSSIHWNGTRPTIYTGFIPPALALHLGLKTLKRVWSCAWHAVWYSLAL